jgi:hypothetical protein
MRLGVTKCPDHCARFLILDNLIELPILDSHGGIVI